MLARDQIEATPNKLAVMTHNHISWLKIILRLCHLGIGFLAASSRFSGYESQYFPRTNTRIVTPANPSPSTTVSSVDPSLFARRRRMERDPEVYLEFRGGGVENNIFKTTLGTLDRDSNLNLPVIGSLVYCVSSAIDIVATEAAYGTTDWKKHGIHFDRLYCNWAGSNPDLPVFGSLIQHETSLLDHVVTEAERMERERERENFIWLLRILLRMMRKSDIRHCSWFSSPLFVTQQKPIDYNRIYYNFTMLGHSRETLTSTLVRETTITITTQQKEEINDQQYHQELKQVHPTEIRTLIFPSSAVELNTTGALANYATEKHLPPYLYEKQQLPWPPNRERR
uniref:Uncharacterized protein n=1 Tax=Timema monikensis TaxID=170555 RepID=A0A7R9E8T4_9NEOP|nr:unnamed protein product [Timema monikensis]